MQGGTYARALEAGFTDKQATFFSHFSIDLSNETNNMVLNSLKSTHRSLLWRGKLAKLIHKLGDKVNATI